MDGMLTQDTLIDHVYTVTITPVEHLLVLNIRYYLRESFSAVGS
jgi:hypothetical protein